MPRDRRRGYMERILRAKVAVESAQDALVQMLEREIPVGSRIGVRLGRADIKGTVTGYQRGRWCGRVCIVNEATGKRREFAIGYDDWYLLRKGPSPYLAEEVA